MSKQETVDNIVQSALMHWEDAYKDFSPAILRLHRIHSHLDDDLQLLLSKYSYQKADFGILVALRRSAPPYCLSPTELYRSMLFSSGGLTKVLNRVTKAGLVERVDNPEDGRSKLVKLTKTGQSLIEQVVVELHEQENDRLSVLSKQEIEQLDQLLSKLLGAWE